MKKGFTLLELLVVVLIIGILAAVAVPQYTKSVEKSRAAEALVNLKALDNAMQVYVFGNGQATNVLEDLSIDLAGEKVDDSTIKLKNFTYSAEKYGEGRGYELVARRNNNGDVSKNYYIYYAYNGALLCVARQAESKYVCSAICSKNTTESSVNEGYFSCIL